MQERTRRASAPRSRKVALVASRESIMARVVERAIDNPAMTGGLFVMALTAAAIVSNAMLLQTDRHPDPLFMTRPIAAEEPVPLPVPRPRISHPDEPAPVTTAAAPAATVPAPVDARTLASLQRVLAAKGFYHGKIDGQAGSRTRAAITAYEQAAGLPVTGEPSRILLDYMKSPAGKAPLKPTARPTADADVTGSTEATALLGNPSAPPVATIRPAPTPAPPPVMVAPAPAPVPVVLAPSPTPTPGPDPAAAARDRLMKVQNALNRIGYGPVAASGTLSDETVNALRRFELDNGLPISSGLDDRVLSRLGAIGALAAN